MDAIRIAWAVLSLCLAAPAAAQTVYRCRTGDTWAYQDRPCSGTQAEAGTHTIRASQGGGTPPAVQQMLDKARAKEDWAQVKSAHAAESAAQPPAEPPRARRNKGYRCTAGRGFRERVVFQTEPCSEMMETRTLHLTQTTVDETGRRWTESVHVPVMEKTQQKEMSASDACEGRRAQQDPYERYKRSNPCR
jgi:hypothetical protein